MVHDLLRDQHFGMRKPEQTVPPDGERIVIHAVWAVEAYTPLHAEVLFRRLEQLGFGRDTGLHPAGIRRQLERTRSGPRGGSWLNLDHVFPPSTNRAPWSGIEATLPPGVRVARPALHGLTPSVTVLVIQFVLDDEAAGSFDRLSRELEFKAQARQTRDGVSVKTPDQVKEGALLELRRELRGRGSEWIKEHLPGAFSAGLGGYDMPTAELVTTELALPFSRAEQAFDYLSFAGLGWDPIHWCSSDLPGWRLAFDREDDFIVVAGRRSDVLADEAYARYGGDDERWAFTYRTHECLDKDLALWGASKLLLAFHARLATIRDHGLREHGRFGRASKRLKTIRDEFLRDAVDARIASAELERYAADERRFEWNALDWRPSDDFQRDDRLLENLRRVMSDNADALSGAEARLRDSLIVDSTVAGTLANLRLQSRLLLIGLAALLIAVASLFVALRANDRVQAPPPAQTTTTRH